MKETLSSPFFRDTRISSCQYVVTKNGQTQAVSFPHKKTGWMAHNSLSNQRRQGETMSMNSAAYRTSSSCHAGMRQKPLQPYNPSSFRSRLPTADMVMPYRNASIVEIGDRSSYNPRSVFKTTYKTFMVPSSFNNFGSNQGIIAAKAKWTHLRLKD